MWFGWHLSAFHSPSPNATPGGRSKSPHSEGKTEEGGSEKTVTHPKTPAPPLQNQDPGAGLSTWYSVSAATWGCQGLGALGTSGHPTRAWALQRSEPTNSCPLQAPQCCELGRAAHTLQSPLPRPPAWAPLEKNALCHQLPRPGRELVGYEFHIVLQGLLSKRSK